MAVLSVEPSAPASARRELPPSMVERMTLIMDAFTGRHARLTLEEVARATRLPRSTAHRILDQLVRLDWLDHTASGYRLGKRTLAFGSRDTGHGQIREAVAPLLHSLHLRTGMVVQLAVLEGAEILYLDKIGGRFALAVPSRVGGRAPAHSTALGKAILAWLDPEQVEAATGATIKRLASRTITDVGVLHGELRKIRQRRGLAFERGESFPGVSCVASAVHGPDGPVAGISLAGDARAPLERVAPLTEMADAAASRAGHGPGRRTPLRPGRMIATDLTRRPGVITVRVVRVVRETADAHSLVLEPADGDYARLSYRPGQFLTIRIPTGLRPQGAARCYSLSSSPVCDEHLQVTVKRISGGYGSNWLCDNVSEGDLLEVLRPAGLFTPASLDADLLLVAAGSGITPVMSICKSVLRAGRGAVSLVYANRDEKSVIFRDALAALAAEHGGRLTVIHWLESVQGLPAAAGVAGLLRPHTGREAFVCGPGTFMSLVADVLSGLGVPRRRIRLERFESLTADPFAGAPLPAAGAAPGAASGDSGEASTVEVTLDGQRQTLAWPRGSKLVDVLLAAGLDAPFSCREGSCSACACVLLEGDVEMARNSVLDASDLADGLILGCQATPVSERLRITYDS